MPAANQLHPNTVPNTPSGAVSNVALLYVPCGSEAEALSITGTLLKEHLAACGNIYPSKSVYSWQGERKEETEYVLLLKTTPDRAARCQARVVELHSYEVPCVILLEPGHANYAYAAWVREQVHTPEGSLAGGVNPSEEQKSASDAE
jgi:periplasmic divalent cation tolerance protein